MPLATNRVPGQPVGSADYNLMAATVNALQAYVSTLPAGGTGGTANLDGGTLDAISVTPVLRKLGHAFWNTPRAANAPIASTSANMVARMAFQCTMGPTSTPINIAYGAPYNANLGDAAYRVPIYAMPAGSPRTPVYSRAQKGGFRAKVAEGVPLPNPALLPDGVIAPTGTDGAVVILDLGTFESWDFYQLAPTVAGGTDPAGYSYRCTQGGYMADYRTHPGWWSGSGVFGGGAAGRPLGFDQGASASGSSLLGNILTVEDFYAPVITHPLKMSLPVTGGASGEPNLLTPATRYDRLSLVRSTDPAVAVSVACDPYRVPEGTWFRLPTSFDIDAWVAQKAVNPASSYGSTAAILKKILVCLRDYGVGMLETAGNASIAVEHTKPLGTPYHPYSVAQKPPWGNFMQQLPFSAMVQLAPTADISVPEGA